MHSSRLTDTCHAARLSLRERRARALERDALARVGETIAKSPDVADTDTLRDFLTVIRAGVERIDAIELALVESMDADRADYVTASRWTQPVVILRGLCVRHVLRQQRRQVRCELRPCYEALGKTALAEPGASRHVSSQLAERVELARTQVAAASNERAQRLQPWGGAPLPAWAGGVANEGRHLGASVLQQTRNTVFPKLPALAGLVAGWWVANSFTDSRWQGLLDSVGLGSGGRRVVSEDTMQALSFWLPILSAAFCAYLCDRIVLAIKIRYRPRAAAASAGSPAPAAAQDVSPLPANPAVAKAPAHDRSADPVNS